MAALSGGGRAVKHNKTSKFSHPLHASNLLEELNITRKIGHLCDAVVVIDDAEIPVQKYVLAAASPYFRALFTYDAPAACTVSADLRTPPCRAVLDSSHVNQETFASILDYMYTSIVELGEHNIQDMIQASDILLMSDLKETCCDYLEQCVTVANCLGIRDFAERFSCPRIQHMATSFIDEHFLEVSFSEEFLQLSVDQLREVVSRDSLVINTENVVFDSILRWVRHDPEHRQPHLQELTVGCVHLGLLDERYLQEHVVGEELVRASHLEPLILRLHDDHQQQPRRGHLNMVVAVGGEGSTNSHSDVVEIKSDVRCVFFHEDVDARVSAWIDLAPMLTPRIGHSMVEAGGCVYVVGGRDNTGRILHTGEKYDPATNHWTPIPPMNHARVGFGLVTIGDKIYAIGGSNDMSDPLISVEEFNIYTNRWRSVPDMNLKRAWSAVAVANKKIYVIAGGIMGKLYEAVECFDPSSETWASVAPMKERRFDARAIGCGDDIYVFGGCRRFECPSAMQTGSWMKFCGTEVYSTEIKQWSSLNRDPAMCTMTDSSHIDSIARCKNEILLIGDMDVQGESHAVRAYNPGSNEWRGVIRNQPPHQRGMQAVVLKMPCALIQTLMSEQGHSSYTDMLTATTSH